MLKARACRPLRGRTQRSFIMKLGGHELTSAHWQHSQRWLKPEYTVVAVSSAEAVCSQHKSSLAAMVGASQAAAASTGRSVQHPSLLGVRRTSAPRQSLTASARPKFVRPFLSRSFFFFSNFPVTFSTTLCTRRQSSRNQAPSLLETPPRSQRRRTENTQHLPKDESLGGLDVHLRLRFWQRVRDSDAVARTKIAAPSFPLRFLFSALKKEEILSGRHAGCSGLQERRETGKSQYESGSGDDRCEIAREQMGSLARRRVSRT